MAKAANIKRAKGRKKGQKKPTQAYPSGYRGPR